MAKLQKEKESGKLEIKYPLSAGVDIGATLMQVCVPATLTEDNNRSFGTTTDELRRLTSWLKGLEIDHVAMEATGIYWIPMFLMMCSEGLNPVLLNAADVKNYTARKTDVNDAEWLMTLMRYGMVKPSFQVNDVERRLRNYTRHRQSLVTLASDVIRRMQKCLELMNVKLTEVISDITGKSGIKIIEAILSGCTDPDELASLADAKCKKSLDLDGGTGSELYSQFQERRSFLQLVQPVSQRQGLGRKDIVKPHEETLKHGRTGVTQLRPVNIRIQIRHG